MNTQDLKISIIGAGNMGGAIARGFAKGSLIKTSNIVVSDISANLLEALKLEFPEIHTTTSNVAAVKGADVVIVAVKPWIVEKIADEIEKKLDYKNQLLISVAAGVDFARMIDLFDSDATLFRVIPNTAIDVQQSVTTISALHATNDQELLVIQLFNELGKTFFVPESQLNAFMSLSSCGIAYAFRYIRAAMQAGVEMGIHPQTAKNVVLQTLRGAIEILETNGQHPEAEIDKVTTPAGITIKGLNEMEANGFSNAVIKGIIASHLK